jgi:hypothetical protein
MPRADVDEYEKGFTGTLCTLNTEIVCQRKLVWAKKTPGIKYVRAI